MPDPGPVKNLPRIINLFDPKISSPVWKTLSKELVKSAHEAGILVIADDSGPDTWGYMLSWGVDGIQTDDVDGLIARLMETKAP